MAYLKEISPLVTICIPFGRNPLPDWSISLASIAPPMNATLSIRRTINQVRDIARNELAEKAIEDGSKFILCLDDDVTVPQNILRALLYAFSNADDDVMVIGGIYCTKTIPPIPLVFQHQGEGAFYNWKVGDVFPCEIVATGMMMIRTEVFKHLSKPWFKDVDGVEEGKKYNLIPDNFDGSNFAINDDGFFCRKVTEAGFKILAHGGVLGIHWSDKGDAFMLPSDSYPVRSEIEKRWGKDPAKDEKQYFERVMSVYRQFYGYLDLLPLEQDLATV